jgi:hypothetical protein
VKGLKKDKKKNKRSSKIKNEKKDFESRLSVFSVH